MSVCISFLCIQLYQHGWTDKNMGRAYELGCLMASAPLDNSLVQKCNYYSGMFAEVISLEISKE